MKSNSKVFCLEIDVRSLHLDMVVSGSGSAGVSVRFSGSIGVCVSGTVGVSARVSDDVFGL